MATLSLTMFDTDGNEVSMVFPAKMVLCPDCAGETEEDMENEVRLSREPIEVAAEEAQAEEEESFDEDDGDDFYEDEDEHWGQPGVSTYAGHAGPCETCKGKNVIAVIKDTSPLMTEERKAFLKAHEAYEEREYHLEIERAAERRMGC